MKALTAFAALAAFGLSGAPAWSDSTTAYCRVSPHDHTIKPSAFKPCRFSQYQGNAYVTLDGKQYAFPYAEQGKSYSRQASSEGIAFHVEGDYSLNVMWGSPQFDPRGL